MLYFYKGDHNCNLYLVTINSLGELSTSRRQSPFTHYSKTYKHKKSEASKTHIYSNGYTELNFSAPVKPRKLAIQGSSGSLTETMRLKYLGETTTLCGMHSTTCSMTRWHHACVLRNKRFLSRRYSMAIRCRP